MRKIIQICVAPAASILNSNEQEFYTTAIFALCNDGSVWQLEPQYGKWYKVPDIPQDANSIEEGEESPEKIMMDTLCKRLMI